MKSQACISLALSFVKPGAYASFFLPDSLDISAVLGIAFGLAR
jgi:hypothetical protein